MTPAARRRTALVLALAAGALLPAARGYCDDDPANFFSVNLGMNQPRSYVDFTNVGGGKALNGKPGYAAGVQYLYHPSPVFGFGVEVDAATRSKRDSNILISNGKTTVSGQTVLAMLVMRLVALPHAFIHPYLLLGGGYHLTTLKMESKPLPGYSWADTGTMEQRSLYNSRAGGAAAMGRVGLEVPLGDTLFLAAEGGLTSLGRVRFKPTPAAQALGFPPLQGTMLLGQAFLRVGARF